MKIRKLLSLLLAVAMILSLAACSSSGDSSSESESTTTEATETEETAGETTAADTAAKTSLVYGVDSEPNVLDPIEATDNSAYTMFRAVYETLWNFDTDGNITYLLATGYEYDETETVLTIHLREGVTFHNGEAFTAEDVLYTYKIVAEGTLHGDQISMIDFDNTVALDDYTIEMHLTQVSASLVYLIAQPFMMIRSEEFCEANEDSVTSVANGTGPYCLEAWNKGDSFELVRNDNYWGEAANYETVTIKFISDSFTRMLEFEAGTLDVAMVSTSTDADDLLNGAYSGASLVQQSNGSVWCLEVNTTTEPWDEMYNDINLRKALFCSIDVDSIVTYICGSTCTKATSVLPSSCWAYVDMGGYEYDVEYAKECLAAAGYEEGELSISVIYQPGDYVAEIWEAIQEYWAAIGVNLTIEGAEASVWGPGMIAGDFAFTLAAAQNCVDPSDAFLTRKIGGMTPCLWPTDELLELDAAAESVTDTAERQEYYTQIQELMYEGYWALPIFEETSNWAVSDSVTGWAESCDGQCIPNLALVG